MMGSMRNNLFILLNADVLSKGSFFQLKIKRCIKFDRGENDGT